MPIITVQASYRVFVEDEYHKETDALLPWTKRQIDITRNMLGMGPLLTENDIADAAICAQYAMDPFRRIENMRNMRAAAIQSLFDSGARDVMQAVNQHEGFQNIAEEVLKWKK